MLCQWKKVLIKLRNLTETIIGSQGDEAKWSSKVDLKNRAVGNVFNHICTRISKLNTMAAHRTAQTCINSKKVKYYLLTIFILTKLLIALEKNFILNVKARSFLKSYSS